MITCYTAIYWWFDILKKQPKQNIDCRFVCITDNPDIKQEEWAEWEIMVDNTYKHLHPRLQARYRKTHPFEKFDWDVIRIDWWGRLMQENSLEYLMSFLEWDILTHKHATRTTPLEEAEWCRDNISPKSVWLPIVEQVLHYYDQWYDELHWLSATGMLIFKKSNKLTNFLDMWFNEMTKRTYQDQLSFEYCIWKCDIDRDWFPFNQFNTEHINFLHNHLKIW